MSGTYDYDPSHLSTSALNRLAAIERRQCEPDDRYERELKRRQEHDPFDDFVRESLSSIHRRILEYGAVAAVYSPEDSSVDFFYDERTNFNLEKFEKLRKDLNT